MYSTYIEHVSLWWEKNTTIDRIDNKWNYCKNNCRRATILEQAHNKTKKRSIEKKNKIYLWDVESIKDDDNFDKISKKYTWLSKNQIMSFILSTKK